MNLFDHPRLVKHSAIRDRGNRRNDLNRRHAYFLSDRYGPDSAWVPILDGTKLSAIFSGQFNSGKLADSEGTNRIVKPGCAELKSNLDRAYIAGMRKNVANAEHSERMPVMNQPAREENGAHLTIHHFVRVRDSVFNCAGHGDYFEGRTGFVGGGDGTIHAHIIGVAPGVIRIKRRKIRQRQQLPGVWILNYDTPMY